ncbi:MAG: hypothetical protein V1790_18840 [Planctomycetota bacterium]
MAETLLDPRGLDSTRATRQGRPIVLSAWPELAKVQNSALMGESVAPDEFGLIFSESLAFEARPTIQIVFSPKKQDAYIQKKQDTYIQLPEGAGLFGWLRNQYVHGLTKDVPKLTGDLLQTMVTYSCSLRPVPSGEFDSANIWCNVFGREGINDSLDAPSELHVVSDADREVDDRRKRYARLSALLDEWASEPPEFDSRVGPLIEKALRESAPRHFPRD